MKDCKRCEYGYRFNIGDYHWFFGCTCPPYNGRAIDEIDVCPKDKNHPTEKGGD